MPEAYDAIIVGAGPAGSIAALVLARAGRRVALLDRAAFPRTKVCGNCLNPSAWEIWDRLKLTDAFSALPHQDFSGYTIESEGRRIYSQAFRGLRHGPRAVGRDILDDWLRREAEAAGAEFHPETSVTGVDAEAGTVQTSRGVFSGRLVLGADGRNSIVARLTGLMPAPRRCHRVAWQATIPAPDDLDDRVSMHLFEEGYFGYCRFSPTQAVISMVLDARRTQSPLALVRRRLPDLPQQEWLRMNPISRAPARLGRDRVWLIGDSARVVEPFTGEGIYFGLKTGLLAAEAAELGFRENKWAAAFGQYARRHARLYRRRAWVNTLLRLALETPSRTTGLLRRVKPAPALVSFLSNRVHAS